jgi:alanine racemase
MPKATETVLEIDLDALGHNFRYLKSKLKNTTKLLGVVKAYGYGSDAVEIAKELQHLGVAYLAVAYVKEGVLLRNSGITVPIMVLHPQVINFEVLIDHCLEPNLYSNLVLNKFIEVSEKKDQKDYPIHIKFNTGLNRLGFLKKDIPSILEKINSTDSVRIRSIFSHLAASEDLSERTFSLEQIAAYKSIFEQFLALSDDKPLLHMCNTSGILNYPEAHFDMVRSGIGLYGFGNSVEYSKELKPVATLKSVISQIHHLKKGETVGYNRSYTVEDGAEAQSIATIPIGHADGISRAYGNGIGWVTINGQKAPIVGNVCMDMIMVNCNGITCNEGDEVILFGQSPSAEILSQSVNSISYELITAISQRVRRVFVKNYS